MNTEQTAQQLKLAAKLIRTGHPWSFQYEGEWIQATNKKSSVANVIANGYEIRLVLATPPDNRPLHNPDNLTAEQVGVGYRLLLPEEVDGRHEGKCQVWNGFGAWSSSEAEGTHVQYSCRLPLSVPWPEAKPDAYAALKKAHAAGKVIQFWNEFNQDWESSPVTMAWCYPPERYRIKPDAPPFQLPPPPPGMQWSSGLKFIAEDLPIGTRPLTIGEEYLAGDEYWSHLDQVWKTETYLGKAIVSEMSTGKTRTRRPLTFTHAGKTWAWHRPGDPMPCDGEREVYINFRDGSCCEEADKAQKLDWSSADECSDIIGWRYADEKKTVPLGPEDVMKKLQEAMDILGGYITGSK